jgi:acetolactate synthase small subunit
MPQFCPSEKSDEDRPLILVDRCDFMVVMSRLYKIKQRKEAQEEMQVQNDDSRQHDQRSLMRLFVHFSQSLMRREEFKLAIDMFGYRDIELPPEFSNTTIQTLRSSLDGRGQD